MANENRLIDIRCPKCGQEDKFFIIASAEFEVTDDGTNLYSNVDWDDDSPIRCAICNENGKVSGFTKR